MKFGIYPMIIILNVIVMNQSLENISTKIKFSLEKYNKNENTILNLIDLAGHEKIFKNYCHWYYRNDD